MQFIIDTYAWVEYFKGSNEGKKVYELFKNTKNEFITMECCLAELKGWSIRNKINFHDLLNTVEANSNILPVNKEIWIKAAIKKTEMMKTIRDFGLIDSILVAKQKELRCKIITADKHFKDLKDIEYIK